MGAVLNALSFDLEDWFHLIGIDGLEDPARWESLPSIFEDRTLFILELLDVAQVKATFFVVGWMASRHPAVVAEVAARGHEIGSHSHWHRTVYGLDRASFADDLARSTDAIGDACGLRPKGFRAPSFSIIPGTEWAFDTLLDAGYSYDASLFPAPRAHGGYPCDPRPHLRCAPSGREIAELPMSVMRLAGRPVAFSGGGYFRLAPAALIRLGFDRLNATGQPAVIYLHPRDFAVDCPSTPMPAHRRFKNRVGVRGAARKLQTLLSRYAFGPCADVLAAAGLSGG